jgi:hypothetical protein
MGMGLRVSFFFLSFPFLFFVRFLLLFHYRRSNKRRASERASDRVRQCNASVMFWIFFFVRV